MKQKTKLTRTDEIPEGWRRYEIGDLVSNISDGGTPPRNGKNYFEGEIPWVIIEDISFQIYDTKEKLTEEGLNKCSSNLWRKNSIILSTGASIGFVGIAKVPLATKQGITGMNVKENIVNNEYLARWFQMNTSILERYAQGSSIKEIRVPTLSKLKIILPPLSEQQKIAEILTTIDETIEETDNIIKKCETIKKGLIEELTLKGLPKYNRKFKKTKIGEIPDDWNVLDLEEVGIFSKGKGISKKELSENGIPCIRYGEIYTTHHFLIKKFNSFIDKNVAEDTKRIFKNDILFAGSGETLEEIGKSVVYWGEEEAYAGGDIIILRVKNHNSLYLSFVLNSKMVLKQKRKLGQGNAVVHIYAKDLKTIKIPIPPIQEQEKIAEIFLTIDKCIEEEKEKKQSLKLLKKSLMQNLLTGKIRVNVN